MSQGIEDARKLAHGTYDDVIVVEHRKPGTGASSNGAVHVVLELPERSRVIDTADTYAIDGVVSQAAPAVGGSYRLIIGPTTKQTSLGDANPGAALRYETLAR